MRPTPLLTLLLATPLCGQYDVFELVHSSGASSVAGLGDVDGDGHADVLAGYSGDAPDFYATGSAAVYSGRDGRVLYRVKGKNPQDRFGIAVAALGDVDRDGWPDFAVGGDYAPYSHLNSQRGPGRVWVFSGKDGSQLYELTGSAPQGNFGGAVAGPGDIDQDGYRDVLVGAQWAGSGGAYVYSGKTGQLLHASGGTNGNSMYGAAVDALGDVNNDGSPDYLVSAPQAEDTARRTVGAVFVVSGKTGQPIHTVYGSGNLSSNPSFAVIVAGIGDVTADGIPDFAAGSAYENPNGGVYVWNGATGLRHRLLLGPYSQSHFGKSLAPAGDVNQDGVPDLLVGMDRDEQLSTRGGAVQLFSGKDFSVLRTYLPELGRSLGQEIAVVGDVNADGTPDYASLAGTTVRVQSLRPLGLTTKDHTSSILYRTPQVLEVFGGAANAGKIVFVLGSASGTKPGVKVGSLTIPLNLDAYLGMTAAAPQAVIFNNLARLDAEGRARVAFVPPRDLPASLDGLVLHHAYIVVEPVLQFASNAVPVRFTMF